MRVIIFVVVKYPVPSYPPWEYFTPQLNSRHKNIIKFQIWTELSQAMIATEAHGNRKKILNKK